VTGRERPIFGEMTVFNDDRGAASPPEARKPARGERRLPRKVTPAYLERAALAYLERFASSAANLKRVLTRKAEKRCRLRGEDASESLDLVDDAVRKAVASGLVDDERYATGRVATLRRRGASGRLIGAKLSAKGVSREIIAASVGSEGEDEEAAAWALARRRRLGPYRVRDRAGFREKDLAAMARGGFLFDLARRVVDGDVDEEG
jgi:regulatory protein